MELLIFVVSLFCLLAFGIPIAIVLALCAIILMLFMGQWDPLTISQSMVMGTNNFPLMAIPFFMLAGEIMAQGGLSERIVKLANLVVGRIKGGLGYAAILASILFAGLSGSAVADAAALGSILVPLMQSSGYKVERAAGFICAGSIIAPIIPPSIPMIVLGTTVSISITRLFMAGIVPGLMLGIALMIVWKFIVKIDGYTDVVTFSREEAKQIVKDSLPALFMPVLIVGGIRLGIFTPTEAGAFAVVYALIVCTLVYKELNLSKIVDICINSAKSTSLVMFIVASASAVGWFITIAQIPNQVASLLGGLIDKPVALLLVINVFLFLIGMVMDLTPNILIFAPVLFPVIIQAGIDPYFFALVMILNLCIGLVTPPVGTVLYVGCSVAKISFAKLVKGILPFIIVELVILLICIIFPQLVIVPVKFIMGS
ncbi:TRAP transporter large permease [Petroclostridium xylanilyticum]|jgi:tripartite ATP-independent transporter DctM subunit|uniref:TRAP transporter large permease n=1 Tax=Petroclostridium xylanilyticum TaxID=1792311 RepID=UPI000B98A2D1|nr:TRAP transporter large permease subunit [Petroclostridium xylanilyticum]